MQFFFKTLMLSIIISLPQISFANSRSDAAVNFLSGLLGAAKALEEQRSQKNEQPQPHSMPRGEQLQTYSTQDNTTSQGVLSGSYRYEINNKEGFLRGINDGRVWRILSADRTRVCINNTDCYKNIYTKNSPQGLQNNLSASYYGLSGTIIPILENSYGLESTEADEKLGIWRVAHYQTFDSFIGQQLTIIALLNSSIYSQDSRLLTLLDDGFKIFNENFMNSKEVSNSSINRRFLEAFVRLLKDYDSAWKIQAPIAFSNSYYLKQGMCKESNSYALYNAAFSAKQMDSTVEMNEMSLKLIAARGGRDKENVAGQRNLAASLRSYHFDQYKKLGGRATSVASIEVPPNPCK